MGVNQFVSFPAILQGGDGPQAAIEDVPRSFNLSVNDVDLGAFPLLVDLSSSNGSVITLPGVAGLTFTFGDGTADGAMTFTGGDSSGATTSTTIGAT